MYYQHKSSDIKNVSFVLIIQISAQACNPSIDFRVFLMKNSCRFGQGYLFESDLFVGPQLPQFIQIRADDLCDFRITADGLPFNAEHNTLAIARYLHTPGTDRFGNEFATGQRQRFAVKA